MCLEIVDGRKLKRTMGWKVVRMIGGPDRHWKSRKLSMGDEVTVGFIHSTFSAVTMTIGEWCVDPNGGVRLLCDPIDSSVPSRGHYYAGYHSCINLEDALKFRGRMMWWEDERHTILKCQIKDVVATGTQYGAKCTVSRMIRLLPVECKVIDDKVYVDGKLRYFREVGVCV